MDSIGPRVRYTRRGRDSRSAPFPTPIPMRLLSLFLLGLFAVGCASSGALGTSSDSVVGPTWRLVTLGSDLPAGPEATITFGADGRVSGTTGCNRFSGTYELASEPGAAQGGRALSLSPLATTRMACPPPAGDRERRVLDALDRADRVAADGDRLVLSAGSDRLLTFEAGTGRTAGATLTGTVTYLPRIALPPDAVVTVRLLDVSLADAPSVTLAEQTISTQGRSVPIPFELAYDAGEIQPRHRYGVRAEIRSGSGDLMWTTDTMTPVLTNGAPSSAVEVRVVQVGESTGALVGPAWRLVEIESASGVVVSPGDAPYTIAFGADGRYSGRADCNRYGGSFEAEADGALRLGQGLSTLAACPSPSASDDFFRVLNGAASYALTGDRLRVTGREGAPRVRAREPGRDAAAGDRPGRVVHVRELRRAVHVPDPDRTGRGRALAARAVRGPRRRHVPRARPGPGRQRREVPGRPRDGLDEGHRRGPPRRRRRDLHRLPDSRVTPTILTASTAWTS